MYHSNNSQKLVAIAFANTQVMPLSAHSPGVWTACLLLLFAILSTEGAALSSSVAASASASSDFSTNQRSARSAAILDPGSSGDLDKDNGGCSSDFVETFFRLLSGPVGKEAEALVAAVLKLLSENDRVNWPAMAESDSQRPLAALQPRDIFLPSQRRISSRSSPSRDDFKRLAPKFNPTGWRRKRAVEMTESSLKRLLRGVLARHVAASELQPISALSAPEMVEQSDDVSQLVPEVTAYKNRKRNGSRGRVWRRLPQELKLKRKPLEFNPTGW